MGSQAREGDSPVDEICDNFIIWVLSRAGHEKSCLNLGGPPPKAKHILRSIANEYREGKVKRTPDRGVK